MESLAKLKKVHNKAVKDTTQTARTNALKIRTLLKARPLPAQGLPAQCVSWFGENVRGVKADREGLNLESCGSIVTDPQGETLDWNSPTWWCADSKSVFAVPFTKYFAEHKRTLDIAVALKKNFSDEDTCFRNMAQLPWKVSAGKPSWLAPAFHKGGALEVSKPGVMGTPYCLGTKQFGFGGHSVWKLLVFVLCHIRLNYFDFVEGEGGGGRRGSPRGPEPRGPEPRAIVVGRGRMVPSGSPTFPSFFDSPRPPTRIEDDPPSANP